MPPAAGALPQAPPGRCPGPRQGSALHPPGGVTPPGPPVRRRGAGRAAGIGRAEGGGTKMGPEFSLPLPPLARQARQEKFRPQAVAPYGENS